MYEWFKLGNVYFRLEHAGMVLHFTAWSESFEFQGGAFYAYGDDPLLRKLERIDKPTLEPAYLKLEEYEDNSLPLSEFLRAIEKDDWYQFVEGSSIYFRVERIGRRVYFTMWNGIKSRYMDGKGAIFLEYLLTVSAPKSMNLIELGLQRVDAPFNLPEPRKEKALAWSDFEYVLDEEEVLWQRMRESGKRETSLITKGLPLRIERRKHKVYDYTEDMQEPEKTVVFLRPLRL